MTMTMPTALLAGTAMLCTTTAWAKDVKVAFIPCGQINDGSWSEAGYIGVKTAKDNLAKAGITMTIDSSESLSPSQAEVAARDYAKRGYQTVVLHCGTFADAAYNAGKDFPNTNFLIAVAPKSVKNVWTYTPAMQDISFIAGYLAAKMSKTGGVGVVASFNFSNITWQAEGFRLGARYGKPGIKTFSTYINSFDDAGKAKEAAQAEIDAGADVIYSATDQASRGIYAAAETNDALAIASYSDQSQLSPKTVLTSALANIPLLLDTMVEGSVNGSLTPDKPYAVGMAGGIGALAMNPALVKTIPADVLATVQTLTADIKTGKLKIPALSEPGKSEQYDLATLKAH
ncbi:BMP family protein [Beijerinckia sp. L45]|uniref:BMP family lipoprotein n=1 Tax=Beijerinckia sp. L45 TaxID=1641855 RepID=UPI00131C81B8|nr:BMP family protein [Beijerinckia sp. L45]